MKAKVTGETSYVDDLPKAGAARVKLVLSPHPHAQIVRIGTEDAKAVTGVVDVLTGEDIAILGVGHHETPLAHRLVKWSGQPVAAVIAESDAIACDAAELVDVEYKLLEAVMTPESAMLHEAPLVVEGAAGGEDAAAHGSGGIGNTTDSLPRNCTAAVRYTRGDTGRALAAAQHVVRRRFTIGATHHVPIETHAVRARAHVDGQYTIWTTCQGGFEIRDGVARLLSLPIDLVSVVPMTVGGAFGGKLLPLLEPLACLIARRIGRDVHIALTRSEEFLFARGCPGGTIEIALGADDDGTISALEFKAVFDTGAGPGGLGSAGSVVVVAAYRVPNLTLECFDIATNKSPVTAYRAPGGPQGFFALESALDELAATIGMDPLDLRIRNATRTGDPDLDGSPFPTIGLVDCLETARRHPLWSESCSHGEGVGAAVGSVRGARQACSATMRIDSGGTVVVQTGSVDITGTDETLATIAAQALGVDRARVRVSSGSTDVTPFAGPASGSKTTYTVGSAVLAAASALRLQILDIAAEILEVAPEDLEILSGIIRVRGAAHRNIDLAAVAAHTGQAESRHAPLLAHGRVDLLPRAPMFTVHLSKVRVDSDLGTVQVLQHVAIQDVGHALNPPAIVGQVHGGTVQGMGRILGEGIVYNADGQLLTASLLDYSIPTVDQIPDLEVVLVECPSEKGPFGARGVAEPPAVPAPAAIANAIARATGVRISQIPLVEEQLLQL